MRTAELKVVSRSEGSKSENRRLRREGMIPANIYGPGVKNSYCAFDWRDLKRAIGTASASNLLFTIQSDYKDFQGKRVILKALQKDPTTWSAVHVDLYEVSLERPITVNIPLEYKGVPEGVKIGGGIFQIVRRSISIQGLADDIPDTVEVDISALQINESLHISDLKVSEKLKVMDSSTYTLCSVIEQAVEEAPTIAAAATTEAGAAEAGGEAGAAPAAPAAEAEKK